MYTLIIVDMQPFFSSSNKVVNQCLREIQKAKKDNANIIFLEYEGCGPTHDVLIDSVVGYDKKWKRIKCRDDGSEQVYSILRRNNLSQDFKVVGVNTGACVFSTMRGLITVFGSDVNIDLIEDACYDNNYHSYGLECIKRLNGKNMRIL